MDESTLLAGFLAWQDDASASARVGVVLAISLCTLGIYSSTRRLSTIPALLLTLVPVVVGTAACQWAYPQVIVGVERTFSGHWVIGKTHHAGTPLMVWTVLTVVAVAELGCFFVFTKRATQGLRRLHRQAHFYADGATVLVFWAIKAILFWQLGYLDIDAPMIPPPINKTGLFKGMFSVGYCAFWVWIGYSFGGGAKWR